MMGAAERVVNRPPVTGICSSTVSTGRPGPSAVRQRRGTA
jgi:hypothetical protein